MAHLLNIPVSFQFRRIRANWNAVPVRIIGWARRDDGSVNNENLALSSECNGKTIEFPVEGLPSKEWERCVEIHPCEETDEEVEKVCFSFSPRLLVNSESTYLPTAQLRHKGVPSDAWELRHEFLRLKLEEEATVSFLNKWGSWNDSRFLTLSGIRKFQAAVRRALISPTSWFSESVYFRLLLSSVKTKPEYPYASLVTGYCEPALSFTVTSDLLNRAEFRICARPDCTTPYKVKSKHARRYCCQYCAHFESIRRNRRSRAARIGSR